MTGEDAVVAGTIAGNGTPVVVLENFGGFGGSASAPVVARVIKAYYDSVRGRGHYAHLLEGEDVDLSHEEDE